MKIWVVPPTPGGRTRLLALEGKVGPGAINPNPLFSCTAPPLRARQLQRKTPASCTKQTVFSQPSFVQGATPLRPSCLHTIILGFKLLFRCYSITRVTIKSACRPPVGVTVGLPVDYSGPPVSASGHCRQVSEKGYSSLATVCLGPVGQAVWFWSFGW